MKGRIPYETIGSEEQDIVLAYKTFPNPHGLGGIERVSSTSTTLTWQVEKSDSTALKEAYTDLNEAFQKLMKAIPHDKMRESVVAKLELKIRVRSEN